MDLEGGTTGQVLAKASNTDMDFTWTAAASGGGLTLLSTTSLSGAITSITGINQSYKNLVIFIKDAFPSATAGDQTIGVNADTTGASYVQLVNRVENATSALFGANTVVGAYIAGFSMQNTQQDVFSMFVIPDYANTTTHKVMNGYTVFTKDNGNNCASITTCAYHGSVLGITQINVRTSAGTWSAGTVEIYGQN
jgi:hypothetical protein